MKNNIIIAGVPRAGKSTVSHLLSTKYGYQHISMDSIIAGFEKCFPETGVNTYQGLSSMDTLRVISRKMAPFVRAMLDSAEYDEFEPLSWHHSVGSGHHGHRLCGACYPAVQS